MTHIKELDAISKPLLGSSVEPLIVWYRENRRSLPWREEPTPYHVWLSEIMLQQTRIAAVIPYYERFLRAFPTVEALAAADDEKLMKLWEGLGYYSRARNLKAAAERIVQEHGGALPADYKALLALPGVGAYTAGAIASIAFGLPYPAVDGNVLRVITRLCDCHADITIPAVKNRVNEVLASVYPTGKDAGSLTQAIMELGEQICVPNGRPRCVDCPLVSLCRAVAQNTVDELPRKTPKKPRRIEEKTVLILEYEGRYGVERRPDSGLLAGLWGFPLLEGNLDGEAVLHRLREKEIAAEDCASVGRAKHVFTHVEWHMKGYLVRCSSAPDGVILANFQELIGQYAIPRAFAYFLSACTE